MYLQSAFRVFTVRLKKFNHEILIKDTMCGGSEGQGRPHRCPNLIYVLYTVFHRSSLYYTASLDFVLELEGSAQTRSV